MEGFYGNKKKRSVHVPSFLTLIPSIMIICVFDRRGIRRGDVMNCDRSRMNQIFVLDFMYHFYIATFIISPPPLLLIELTTVTDYC